MRKIVTTHVYPTIPVRTSDWCAHYEGEEEAGDYGWGATPEAAIADFIENCAEIHDERLAATLGWRFSPAHDGWINEQHRAALGDGWGSYEVAADIEEALFWSGIETDEDMRVKTKRLDAWDEETAEADRIFNRTYSRYLRDPDEAYEEARDDGEAE